MSTRLKSGLIALAFLLALAGALWVGLRVWGAMGEVEISPHGWIALGLGAFFTLVVGVGLMTLLFYSARHGHDDTYRDMRPRSGDATEE